MAIVNLTDDSFYAPSRLLGSEAAGPVERKEGLCDMVSGRIDVALSEGADIMDLGACSTRPNSVPVSEQVEWERLEPVLELMRGRYPEVPLSVDTFRRGIIERLGKYGVDVVNDVSGGSEDIYKAVAELGATYILTHNQQYQTDEQVIDYFCRRSDMLFRCGVHDAWIDPGFGFGKTLEQNYRMLALIPLLKQMLGLPVLAGLSRKSMIYNLLGVGPEDALSGTIAANTIAVMNGADVLRVHDVKPARDVLSVVNYQLSVIN